MASGKTLYLAQAALGQFFGGTIWTPPASWFVALSSAVFDKTTTGAVPSELAIDTYARVELVNDSTTWAAPNTVGATHNAVRATFPEPAVDWGLVRSYYLCDAATAGHACFGADLDAVANVLAGNPPYFDVGDIAITELI